MKAVVLCAGLGTRLGNVTKDIPKPMLPLNKKPLLLYTLNYLREFNIRDIAINVHYFPEQIMSFFKNGVSAGVNICYSYEEKLLGTAGALTKLSTWLSDGENFLVLYGDILTDQNLDELINKHCEENAFATLLLHKRKKSNSIVKIEKNGRITCFKERPSEVERNALLIDDEDVWVNSGIQVLSKDALEYIIRTQAFDLPRDVYCHVFEEKHIFGVPLTGYRVAIDSEDRYQQAQEAVMNEACKVFPDSDY